MQESRLAYFATILRKHAVEFIVIGGQAEALFGSPRVTYDVDVCYRRTESNLKRLAAALKEIGVKLRGAPDDLPFIIDERSLALGTNFTFRSQHGDFDLLGWVEPIGDFDALVKRAETHDFAGSAYPVIGLDDLITVKRHINRPKDQESLRQLLAIKQVREELAREQDPPRPTP